VVGEKRRGVDFDLVVAGGAGETEQQAVVDDAVGRQQKLTLNAASGYEIGSSSASAHPGLFARTTVRLHDSGAGRFAKVVNSPTDPFGFLRNE
jgi:hypothetical protein